MKSSNSYKHAALSFAAIALLAGCAKEPVSENNGEEVVKVSIEAGSPSTKTYIDGEKIHWSPSGDQLNVVYRGYDANGEKMSTRQSSTDADYTITDGKAAFTAGLSTIDGSKSYKFGAFYPYAYKYSTNKISLSVPQTQSPTLTSFDPKADILVTSGYKESETLPSKLSFTLNRMVALAEMTLVGIGEGEKISKIEITASEKINGAVEFDLFAENMADEWKFYNNYKTMTLEMGDRPASGNDVVWFTTVPTDLSGGTFAVKVTTDKNIYEKTADLSGKTFNFKRAEVARFKVTGMSCTPKPESYKLLTDASDFSVGDKFVICSANYNTDYVRLMSLSANGSGLAAVTNVTVSESKEISPIPEGACILEVERGAVDGTYSFKSESGYLYGSYNEAEYANTLSFKDTKDEESSWTVSVASDNLATIYNAKFDRAVRYYSSKFSFSSASSTYIYYVNGTSDPSTPVTTPLDTPVISTTVSGNVITVSWKAVDGAKDYTVSCGTSEKTVSGLSTEFADLSYSSTYTVGVVANPENAELHTASAKATASVTTEAEASTGTPTVVSVVFPIEGAASGNTVGTVPTGDDNIKIESYNCSWRTDSADDRDAIFMGRTTNSTLTIYAQNGVTITKISMSAPVGYLIDLKWEEKDRDTSGTFTGGDWTGSLKSRIVFSPAGTSHTNIASITVEYTK